MGGSFRGHYPDGRPQPCDVSVSDCRVMNCGVRRQGRAGNQHAQMLLFPGIVRAKVHSQWPPRVSLANVAPPVESEIRHFESLSSSLNVVIL